jgi:DNA-binding Lrp family transcriptional regulator
VFGNQFERVLFGLPSVNARAARSARQEKFSMSNRGETDGEIDAEQRDEWEALRLILQDSRAKLLLQILAHPQRMPSTPELDYWNPSMEASTVQYHLRKLGDAGIIEKVKLSKGERTRDLPSMFFRVTEKGERLLKQANLYEEVETWREVYERMEYTPEIHEIESMPRPS